MDTSEIKEMVPASGWRAVFKVETGFFTEPVAIWAKVEDADGSQRVVGFCPDGGKLRPAPANELFHSYCLESEARFYIEDLTEGRL